MHGLLSLLRDALHVHWFAFHHSDENYYYYECRCGRRSFAYLPDSKGDPDQAWLHRLEPTIVVAGTDQFGQPVEERLPPVLPQKAKHFRVLTVDDAQEREIANAVAPHIERANKLHRRAQKAEGQLQRMIRKVMDLPQPSDKVWLVWDRGTEKANPDFKPITTRRIFLSIGAAEAHARLLGWCGEIPTVLGVESASIGDHHNVRVLCLPVK